jgi:hypothetical protein
MKGAQHHLLQRFGEVDEHLHNIDLGGGSKHTWADEFVLCSYLPAGNVELFVPWCNGHVTRGPHEAIINVGGTCGGHPNWRSTLACVVLGKNNKACRHRLSA